jgi:hypothetical protein
MALVGVSFSAVFVAAAAAQELQPTVRAESRADLACREAAKVAWAAHRAGEAHDVTQVSALKKALKSWTDVAGTEAELVRLQLLDALLRLDAKLPGNELVPLAMEPRTLIPALVLLAQQPRLNECALFDLFRSGPSAFSPGPFDEKYLRTLVIGDLLASQKTPGFAALVWRQLDLRLQVRVISPELPCHPEHSLPPSHRPCHWPVVPGFPPDPHFGFQQCTANDARRSALLAAGSLFEVRPPDLVKSGEGPLQVARGIPAGDSEMIFGGGGFAWIERLAKVPLTERLGVLCVWTTPAAFVDQVQSARGKWQQRQVETLRALVAAGAMTETEAASLRPTTDITINYDGRVDKRPLPDLPPLK